MFPKKINLSCFWLFLQDFLDSALYQGPETRHTNTLWRNRC